MPEPINPEIWDEPAMRRILAARDIGVLYCALKDVGVSQRQIAERTGQNQSEVSEILKGRQVRDVTLLERIADGLGIPRGYLRLGGEGDADSADSADGAYCGLEGGSDPEVDEEMRRRVLIAATSLAALGRVVRGMGELAELALPRTGDEPLPLRLSMSHVHAVEAVTERLRSVARQYGGQAEVFGAAAKYYTRWMGVPATDAVKARLGCALAEVHTEAGWCCYDSGVDAAGHFTRALKLADEAGDAFGIANAAWHAGTTLLRSGHPDDALKAFQLGGFPLGGFQPGKSAPASVRADDPRVPTVTARLGASSAAAYALLDHPEQARRALAAAREDWAPHDVYERAEKDLTEARIWADLGRLDTAEQFVTAAVHTYGGAHRRDGAMADLVLAELHVRAGEPRGIALARRAIDEVSQLHSVPTRQRLVPLATALEARPGSDARELARLARTVAAGGPQRAG